MHLLSLVAILMKTTWGLTGDFALSPDPPAHHLAPPREVGHQLHTGTAYPHALQHFTLVLQPASLVGQPSQALSAKQAEGAGSFASRLHGEQSLGWSAVLVRDHLSGRASGKGVGMLLLLSLPPVLFTVLRPVLVG